MFNQPIPVVTKNLLIINGLFFAAMMFFANTLRIDLNQYLALHYWTSPDFQPYQLVSYMFMHGGFQHILFNMFGLWMFGSAIENYWGPKRFMVYYFVTGIGAGLIQLLTIYIQVQNLLPEMTPEMIETVKQQGFDAWSNHQNFINPLMGSLNALYNSTVVGASGALFGILLAFGMMFPNIPIYIMFIPIPIKAKYMVAGYGLLELYSGFANNPQDNVAHFAHLGGMLFGIILILYWKKNGSFYKPW
ncbi:MAG: rhomboid family intramembrane serine protease [Bacteroidetes bacterium]|nr:MAG: rhomboid family intramembrane serine protease [Bacteroidota bacterium]